MLQTLDPARFASGARIMLYSNPVAEFIASMAADEGAPGASRAGAPRETWERLQQLNLIERGPSLTENWNTFDLHPRQDWARMYHTRGLYTLDDPPLPGEGPIPDAIADDISDAGTDTLSEVSAQYGSIAGDAHHPAARHAAGMTFGVEVRGSQLDARLHEFDDVDYRPS